MATPAPRCRCCYRAIAAKVERPRGEGHMPQPHPILLCDESMLQYDSCGNCVLIITFYLLFFVGSNYRSLNSTLAALWTSLTSTARISVLA